MGVSSLPKTVTRQRRGRDLNPGPSAPESSTLTTRYLATPVSGRNNNSAELVQLLSAVGVGSSCSTVSSDRRVSVCAFIVIGRRRRARVE